MKRLKSIFKCLPVVLIALLATILYSCQDDSLLPNGDAGRPEEGLPATVSLKVCLPAMDVQTRALTDEEENYVGTIWVGVFKVCDNDDTDKSKDGMCAFNKIYNPPIETSSTYGVLYQVGKMLKTELTINGEELSGKARIVAVANAEHYMGIDPLQKDERGFVTKQSLSTLLSGVETWDQFQKIKVMRNSTTDVTLTSNTLLMSGYYADDKPTEYAAGDAIPTVEIYPSNSDKVTTLSGAIYLRRVISYNKFNITHNENVSLSLKTWRVMNIPYCSYILEEDGNACTTVANGNNAGLTSRLFNIDEEDSEMRTFEFYQLENKHDAVKYEDLGGGDYVGIKSDATDPYQCREREWKSEDDTNSGLYKSLVADSSDKDNANNKASYVELTAELEYYYDKENDPTASTPLDYATAIAEGKTLVHRKAEVTYTIHLGYCEGNDKAEMATDFNCRRNTKYTYNVKIESVNQIVVEAESEDDTEPQPGAEGTVVDMASDPIILDAHYNVFNIQLTDEQRENLRWYITAPYAGRPYIYESNDTGTKEFGKESECYTWIKFRPTSEEKVLAKYCDKNEESLALSTIWSLDDLKNVAGHPNELDTSDDPNGKWYTVFIDEYVYHSDPKGENAENGGNEVLWGNYVDQENRRVDLYNEKMFPSLDQESYYIPAIYSFSQRSIQTHYAEESQNETAFGAEHINENYGLNFDKNNVWNNDKVAGKYNGRYNFYAKFGTNQSWDSWVQSTVPDDVPEAKNDGWNYVTIPAKSYPVPMLKPINTNFSPYYNNDSYYPNSYSKNAYSSGGGCLNRNRDLDGDGIIDVDEMRWYVPASEEYIQLAIGQTELPSPLIKFLDYNRDEFTNSTGKQWTVTGSCKEEQQYHYWTSDNRYFWAEEGMSMGEQEFLNYASHTICYQVRCIRQLGMNPSAAPYTNEKFEYSSSFVDASENGHIYIESKYFTDNSVRPPQSSHLKPHDTSSITSMPPKKFEVAPDICYDISGDYNISVNSDGYLTLNNSNSYEYYWYKSCEDNSICGKYYDPNGDKSDKGTWRVPNIRELAMMRTLGYAGRTTADDPKFAGNSSRWEYGYYLSCTYGYFEYATTSDKPYFKYKFLGKRGDDNSLAQNMIWNPQEGPNNTIHVRCVRDVMSSSDTNVEL